MSTQHEEMLKRFDELDMSGIGLLIKNDEDAKLVRHSLLNIKLFIESEIDLAVANREKEIVEIIKSKGIFVGENRIFNIYVKEILSLILKNK